MMCVVGMEGTNTVTQPVHVAGRRQYAAMTTAPSPPAVDWQGWLDRWEAQQGAYMPNREERFDVMIGALAALCGEAPHIVDLGSGPGSLARRVLERLPNARVTALDMDPVLLAIGRNALGDQGGRLRWLDADLRSRWRPDDGEQVDAAVSTTALHWLRSDALAALYRHLGTVLAPGGVFVNGDRLDFPHESPRIAAAVEDMREQRETTPPPAGTESWEEWWAAVEQEPGFADQVAERKRRHHDHPDHDHQAGIAVHVQALREAGFSEVETIWQNLADRVLVAVR
jgi:SAM-dependent methyltransferase